MFRSWHPRALLLAASLVVPLCACLPTRVPGSVRFDSCSIAVFDATETGRAGGIATQLVEASQLTGVRFRWVGTPDAARYGLTIARIQPGTAPSVMGSYQETFHSAGPGGQHVVVGSIIRLRPGASPGIRRHEIGHLFNLAHNGASTLMRPVPAGTATWSPSELVAMRAMARRSGC